MSVLISHVRFRVRRNGTRGHGFRPSIQQRPHRDGERSLDQRSRSHRRTGGAAAIADSLCYRYFATAGGLISYEPDEIDQYRRAADYVDRIFKGEKPAELPVQAPTKFELAVNLKTAKTLGIAVPQTLLARADKVIE